MPVHQIDTEVVLNGRGGPPGFLPYGRGMGQTLANKFTSKTFKDVFTDACTAAALCIETYIVTCMLLSTGF